MTTSSHTTSCTPSLWTGSADCCIEVKSPLVKYTDKEIISEYDYQTTRATRVPVAEGEKDCWMAEPVTMRYTFKTQRRVPRVGVMLVGWGGNNGSTFTAGIIANALKVKWPSKYGQQSADWYGSLTQCGTVRLGSTTQGEQVHVPIKSILPMLDPNQIVVSGWDISGVNMATAMNRASVLDYELQRALTPHMTNIKPLPSIYYPDFIAANQQDRADNLLPGNDKQAHLDMIREHIRQFRRTHQLDKVIVLWTANTERFAEVRPGLNDTADALLRSIATSANEVAPSTIFAVAAILEGAPFINGSPQNTFVPGVIQLALKHGVFIAGDDFKTGQTKLKSVLVEYLVSAGLKPMSIVSYNHLGNNDGKNLAAPAQFRSKEISKSNVVDDMVASNRLLYRNGDTPDHTVVIKYVPYVGDTKRAMDEYISRIFLGGHNTLTISNICEDSLLAAPLILDLVILTELFSRISYKTNGMQEFEPFDPVLSVLSYLLKAPMVPAGSPVVNALAKQRYCLTNILRGAVGLPPDNDMLLEHKTKASLLRAKL